MALSANYKSFDIAAYTYRAEILCPGCLVERFLKTCTAKDYVRESLPVAVEQMLDFFALCDRIDRQDESSYDSDDFPKVVFVDQVADDERCDGCGGELP